MFRNFLRANVIIIVMIKCSSNTDGTLEYRIFEGKGSTIGLEPKSDIQHESFKEINKSSLGQPLQRHTGNPVSTKNNKNKRQNTYKKDCLVNKYTEGSGTNKQSFKNRRIINQIKNTDVRTDDTLNLNAPSNDYVASHKSASEQSARPLSVSKSSRKTGKCIRRKRYQLYPKVDRRSLKRQHKERVLARMAEMQSGIPNTDEADLQHAKSISSNVQLTNTDNDANSEMMGSSLEHATKPRYINCEKSFYYLGHNIRLFDFATFFEHNRENIITLDGWLDGCREQAETLSFASLSKHNDTLQKILDVLSGLRYSSSRKELRSKIEHCVGNEAVLIEEYRPIQFNDLRNFFFQVTTCIMTLEIAVDTLSTLRESAQKCYKLCIDNMNKARNDNEKAEHFISYLTSFLRKHDYYDFYILRSELWNLQMIMPEFYFYLVWKIKQLEINTTYSSERLFAELDYLHCLLLKYIDMHDKKGDQINDFEQLKKIVDNYRLFIFNELATKHRQEMCYFFYDYSMKCSVSQRSKQGGLEQVVMFLILAFAADSPVFTKFKSNLISIESRTGSVPKQSVFIYQMLLKSYDAKKETLAALQLIAEFINICRNNEQISDLRGPLYIPFKGTTVAISYAEDNEKISIQFLTILDVLSHFYDIVCLLI